MFEAGRSLNFHYFQQVVSEFFNKTVNNTRLEDAPEQNFDCSLKGNQKKTRSSGKSLLVPSNSISISLSISELSGVGSLRCLTA